MVEHQPVVDAVDPAVEPEEAMAALAVGVVAHEVEGAHPPQLVVVRLVLVEREVVLLEVSIDEELHRPAAERPVAEDREGDEAPAERFGQLVGSHLAVVEPGGEVPQGSLASSRLVDRAHDVVPAPHLAEVRGVGAPRHPAEHLQLAVVQHAGGELVRAHRPELIGSPASVHAGAHVPVGIEWQPTEPTRWPSGRHERRGRG